VEDVCGPRESFSVPNAALHLSLIYLFRAEIALPMLYDVHTEK
jgi:hypothetical protein